MNPRLLGLLAATAVVLLAVSVPAAPPQAPLAWLGSSLIAEGRGEKGPWRQNDSRYDYVDDPTVAIDERGELALAWVDQARKDIFFQRYAAHGSPRSAPLNVSRSPETFSWLPRIVFSGEKIFLLWQEIIFSGGSHGGEMLFARSDDGGRNFSAPLNLSNSRGGDGKGRVHRESWHNGSFDLAAGADGALYVVWTEYDGPLWFSVSSDGGRRFSPPRQLARGAANPARAPSLALGPERTVYLAWTVGEDDSADIRVARSADGGATFSEPQVVARTRGYSDAPKLAADPTGALHLVFSESAGGPFDRYHVRYTRSDDGARSFEPPRRLSGSDSGFPALGVDAKSNVYVIWERFPDHRTRPRGLGVAVSRDGGRSFSPPAVIPDSVDPAGGSNGSQQGLLMKKLAVNRHGAFAVVNSSFKENERSRVWLMRGGP